jgi:hypothetical protein
VSSWLVLRCVRACAAGELLPRRHGGTEVLAAGESGVFALPEAVPRDSLYSNAARRNQIRQIALFFLRLKRGSSLILCVLRDLLLVLFILFEKLPPEAGRLQGAEPHFYKHVCVFFLLFLGYFVNNCLIAVKASVFYFFDC